MKIASFVFPVLAVIASGGCGPHVEEGPSGGNLGAGGTSSGGSSAGTCTAPACDGCTSCFALCNCQTKQMQACQSACGSSGGASGAGAGGNGAGASGGFGAGGSGFGGTGTGGTSTGGSGAGGTGTGGSGGSGGAPTNLPQPKGTCQPFVTGDMTFSGSRVKIWAGTPASGPLVIYWYATGSSTAEVTRGLGQTAINEITAQGGVVAAMYQTTGKGTTTNNNVWYTGDLEITDEIVACAVSQQHIDTRRIHALGFSAGGLMSGYMAYARSNYMASVATYSGGSFTTTLQDPSNAPSAMCIHGAMGSDVVVIDFATASANMEADLKRKGGFAMDCNHGGGHTIPTAIVPSVWRFLKDHPYKVTPKPYAGGIPSGFPTYCTIP